MVLKAKAVRFRRKKKELTPDWFLTGGPAPYVSVLRLLPFFGIVVDLICPTVCTSHGENPRCRYALTNFSSEVNTFLEVAGINAREQLQGQQPASLAIS